MGFDETVADDHGRKHHLAQLCCFKSHGQKIVKLLVVPGNQLGPPGVANPVEIVVTAVNA